VGKLWDQIRQRIGDGRCFVSDHAADRLLERGLGEWQIAEASTSGVLERERPTVKPNPACDVRILLPDGTEARAVRSLLRNTDVARLVTVHYYDDDDED